MQEEADVIQRFEGLPNEVIRLSEAARADFVAAVKPVVEATASRFRDELFEYLPGAPG